MIDLSYHLNEDYLEISIVDDRGYYGGSAMIPIKELREILFLNKQSTEEPAEAPDAPWIQNDTGEK